MTRQPLPQQIAECACEWNGMCENQTAGHALHPLRLRLSAATPSKWRDAVVESLSAEGWIALSMLDGKTVRVWHHEALTGTLSVGDPVAVHALYGMLAVGSGRFSILSDSVA